MTINRLIHLHFISLYLIGVIIFIVVIYRKLKNKKGPKELSREKFESTIIGKMVEIKDDMKTIYNIWPFVNNLKRVKIITKKIDENQLVFKAYRDTNNKFEHILLTTEKENNFIVIVVDLTKKKVKGYYKLYLKNEYK
jgi:hypothetical protein